MSVLLYREEYSVLPMDFIEAGSAASAIRAALKELGLDQDVVRRAAISAYEAEMNIVIHGGGGKIILSVYEGCIKIEAVDLGPGISDVNMALQEGFSTAGDEIREMGFGAGMGLPNIKRCVSQFDIDTKPGNGTRAVMYLDLDNSKVGG